jgi:transposase
MSRPAGQTALDTPGEAGRAEAHRRWLVLRAHLEDGVPLARVAAQSGIPHRTLQRWLARYRAGGLAGLGRAPRADRGRSRFPEPLRLLVEGLALRTPAPSAAHVHRQVAAVAEREGWPVPSYSRVYAIICGIDPALRTLAVEGDRRYAEVYELVYRRQASRPNEIWQADHTQLDLWVVTPAGSWPAASARWRSSPVRKSSPASCAAAIPHSSSPAPKPRSRCLMGPTAASSSSTMPSRSHSSVTAARPAFAVSDASGAPARTC